MAHLIVSDVTLAFGGLQALTNVNLSIEPGFITSIIGPNGAGKTSLLNCVSGFYHPTKGVETWKPSQLLFRRKNINYPPEIHEYLKGRYVLVPNGGWSHYLRENPNSTQRRSWT